jgi:hypothetical protein
MTTERTVINIDAVPLLDRGNGKQFAVKWGRVGSLLGLTGLGCAVHVVPPGKKAFPFHRHHVMDELFFVVSGKGEYRFGDSTVPVTAATSSPRRPERKRTSSSIPARRTCAISAFRPRAGWTSWTIPIPRRSP